MNDASKLVYRGKIVDLLLEDVALPNGSHLELEIVRHPGGAAVVALDAARRVCLLRQYRHVAGGWIWEIPAGKLEPNEPPLVTAQRELEEEAGFRATDWHPLSEYLSSPGIFTEVIHLYLATGLAEVALDHEPHEVIEVHWRPLGEALAMAGRGEIRDGKTLAGLFLAEQRLRGA